MSPEHLLITLDGRTNAKARKDFLAMCDNLGASLLIGKGVWGEGIFKSFFCAASGKRGRTKPEWQLSVREGGGQTEFSLLRLARTGKRVVKIPESKVAVALPLASLKDARLTEVIAFDLLDALPFSRLIENPGTQSFSHAEKSDIPLPEPPPSYEILAIGYLPEHRLWVPRMIGKAVVKTDAEVENGEKRRVTWQIEYFSNVGEVPRNMAIWAKKSTDRGAHHNAITKVFEERSGSGAPSLLDSFASGYAGFRYGYPLVKGDPLLEKSQMVGIFTEIRSGPLDGLRWYWDFAPEVSTVEKGNKLEFTWSRATLGWSFGLDFKGLISKVDLVPKVGLMDLDATVGIPSAIAPQIIYLARFRQKNVLNLGLEVGIESSLPWFLLRFWGAKDVSGFVDVGGQTTVSSLRGGIDGYFDLFRFGHYKLALLTFLAADRLSFEKKDVSNDEIVGATGGRLAGLTYDLLYAGVGLTVTW